MNLADALKVEEIEIERSPRQLAAFVLEKIELFHQNNLKKEVLLRQGLMKCFFEEIRPIALTCDLLFKNSDKHLILPRVGNQSFDATIRDISVLPPLITYIEATTAIDGHDDSIRMELLLEHGHVAMTGPLKWAGTRKSGRTAAASLVAKDRTEITQNTFNLIQAAVGKKISMPYQAPCWLVVAFDDYVGGFRDPYGMNALAEWIDDSFSQSLGNFSRLYVVGQSGEGLVEKCVGRSNRSRTIQRATL